MAIKPVMLVIMDGWGLRQMETGNAILLGKTPNYDRWSRTLERSVLDASEEAVGLVPGQMGNSEVGHLNLGAGRVVYQDISRINIAIREGTLARTTGLQAALQHAKKNNSNLHLIGLLSDGGVHSHIDHLVALLKICRDEGVNPVIHVITDGRDTPTESGIGFVEQLETAISKLNTGRIATVSGRYYAMDRDKRWERTQKAYDAMVKREGRLAASAPEAVRNSYAESVTDEFIIPVVIGEDDSLAVKDEDAMVFFNFRADRMRQIASAFAAPGFDAFPVSVHPGEVVTFTEYVEGLKAHILFEKDLLKNVLAEVISDAGMKQYHSAETEKYPHVTFFFNGRREEPYPGEDRHMAPSPKVATYDLKPEMSAYELTEAALERILSHDDDFILINFANPDMVGHTGSLEAAIRAVEVVDECTNRLVEAINAKGGVALVTADHGNCERMIELSTGELHTYHTTNPVAFFAIGPGYFLMRPRGKLADVAPTVLDLLGLPQPAEMTGTSLIELHTPEALTRSASHSEAAD